MNKIIQEDLEFIVNSDVPWDRLEGKTIFIAGANGFVPSYMVYTLDYLNRYILKKPIKISVLIRNPKNARTMAELIPLDSIFIADVCNSIYTKEKVDYIIHAASPASPKNFKKDPVGTALANTVGTHHLLELAKAHNSTFLYFSSGEIYGNPLTIPIKESDMGRVDPLDVRSCYPESKRMGENLCMCYHKQYGIPVKIARLFHTYGPGMKLDDGRMFADFTADVVNKRDVLVKSSGFNRRVLTYLADATVALFLTLLKGKPGEAYNIANRFCEKSVTELAFLLTELFPELNLKVKFTKKIDETTLQRSVARSYPDTTKIEALGWKPKHLLKAGFNRTIRSYWED